jgi:hypothetical protein
MSQRCGPSKVGRIRSCRNANTTEITARANINAGLPFPNRTSHLRKTFARVARIRPSRFKSALADICLADRFGHLTCTGYRVGRVPTRSASSFKWGGRGPLIGWYGLLPPASEREARLDDPIDSATPKPSLRNATLGGSGSQAGASSFFFLAFCHLNSSLASTSCAFFRS